MTGGADAATSRPSVGLIWAESAGVIGRDGGMPWHVPEDLAHFRELTLGAPVIMGRRTWESLPPRFRPLPRRANVVVTRQAEWSAEGAERAASVDEALALAAAHRPSRVWVIGGAELFRQILPMADRLEVTELRVPGGAAAVDRRRGDVLAPALDAATWRPTHVDPADGGWLTSRGGLEYRFVRYARA
jgi:dihydrofolate reductase